MLSRTRHIIHGDLDIAVFRKHYPEDRQYLLIDFGDNLSVEVFGDPDATADAIRAALDRGEAGR